MVISSHQVDRWRWGAGNADVGSRKTNRRRLVYPLLQLSQPLCATTTTTTLLLYYIAVCTYCVYKNTIALLSDIFITKNGPWMRKYINFHIFGKMFSMKCYDRQLVSWTPKGGMYGLLNGLLKTFRLFCQMSHDNSGDNFSISH